MTTFSRAPSAPPVAPQGGAPFHFELVKRFEGPRYHYLHGNHDLVAAHALNAPEDFALEADGVRLFFTHGHHHDWLIRRARWLSETGVWAGGWIRRLRLTALFKAFETAGVHDVPEALALFQRQRLPPMKKIWDAANASLRWYEDMDRLVAALDPIEFAYSYLTRTGRVDHAEVRRRDPRLAAAYEALHPEAAA